MDRLPKNIGTVESRLSNFPGAVPAGIVDVFHDTLLEVRNILKDSDQTVEQWCPSPDGIEG